MKNLLITLGVTSLLYVTTLSSDSLSNSLNGMLNKNDSTGMVNLNGLNMSGKPQRKKVVKRVFKGRPGKTVIGHYNDDKVVYKKEADKYIRKVTKGKIKDLDMLPRKQRLLVLEDLQRLYAIKHFKSRPSKTVIATVNGENIRKKEADAYLKTATKGKVKDFDKLDKDQRLMVVKDLARPMVIDQAIGNDVSIEEKEEIFKQMWLEKQRMQIKVLPEEMLALYENKKAQTLAQNPQAQIPAYISLGDRLKNEILEQKIMAIVMKDINVTINYDSNESVEEKE